MTKSKPTLSLKLINLALADNARRSFSYLLEFSEISPAYLVKVLDVLRKQGTLSSERIDGVFYYWLTPTSTPTPAHS